MDEDLTPYEALVLCRDRAGSDSQMARDLQVSQPKVWRWINQSKLLPAEYVLTAEDLYGVSRHHLRPDIYPASLTVAPEAPGEECGPILSRRSRPVACDRKPKTQRKDVA
jgi:DNA-binding transcriptional regulator YdaS (Cro superfamily)